MKKHIAYILIVSLLFCLAGCRGTEPSDTTASTGPTQTDPTGSTPSQSDPTGQPNTETTGPASGQEKTDPVGILTSVWEDFPEENRFAAYGGMMGSPVDSAPGKLDVSNADEITSRYLVPQEQLEQVEEGASLVHMMNSNLFTAAVFRLRSGSDTEAFAKALRESIQKNQWICGRPDRLVVARPAADTVLVVFGSEDAMKVFGGSFTRLYPEAKIIYDEAIVA